MTLADSSYPLGGVLVSMAVFFGWMLWIWCLVWVYMDLFRRDDIGGWRKAGWVIFTLVLPFLGVFVYLIAEGKTMVDRQAGRALRQQRSFDDHVRRVAGSSHRHSDGEIARAHKLLDSGAVTQDEYEIIKQKAQLR